MNASQRRQFVRATIRGLSALGIVPGSTVERKAPGKATATQATVTEVVEDVARRGHVVLIVRRKDKRETLWGLRELVNPIRLRNAGKGHALRLTA